MTTEYLGRRVRVVLAVALIGALLPLSAAPASSAPSGASPGTPRAAAGAIAAGGTFSCAVVGNGVVKCWGFNSLGQTGQPDLEYVGENSSQMGPNLQAVLLDPSASVEQVVAGSDFACALFAGRVRCWGDNSSGQLGQGVADPAIGADPGDMASLDDVDLAGRYIVMLAAGYSHVCALAVTGEVVCWGSNDHGELGIGSTVQIGDDSDEMGSNLAPVALGTGRTATAVTAGEHFSCALLDDATVKCWGYNDAGRLGIGSMITKGDGPNEMGDNLAAVDLGQGSRAIAVASGSFHACAVLDTGALKCWGENAVGQLGQGNTNDIGDQPGEMGATLAPVDLGTPHRTVAVTAGGAFTCALASNGVLRCFGSGDLGQIGSGSTDRIGDGPGEMGANLMPVDVGTGHTVEAVDAGLLHACAVRDDSSVVCWGSGGEMQLGYPAGVVGDQPGEMGDTLLPVSLDTSPVVAQISAGTFVTCALLDNGEVKCWGFSLRGALGKGPLTSIGFDPGTMGEALSAVDLGSGRAAVRIAAGEEHVCAIRDDGSVVCWGAGTSGALGRGDTVDIGTNLNQMGDTLVAVDLGTSRTAVDIAAGLSFTCALLDDASIKCWGSNGSGQLGQEFAGDIGDESGELGDALDPIDLGAGRTALKVVTGSSHACALLDDNSLKCWGENGNGQLGQGDTADIGLAPGDLGDALAAVALPTGRTVVDVSAGAAFTCAILDTGWLACWGDNSLGQAALGTIPERGSSAGEMGDNLPFQMFDTVQPLTITSGMTHSCITFDDGHIECWGDNSKGQLGLGDTANRGDDAGEFADHESPDLGTAQYITAVDAGNSTSCALLADGAVKCWGFNAFSTLGAGHGDDVGDGTGEMGDALAAVDLAQERGPVAELVSAPAAMAKPGVAYSNHVGVTLSFDPPADTGGLPTFGYRVQRSTNGVAWTTLDDVLFDLGAIAAAGTNEYSDFTVDPATTYWYRIAAYSDAGQGPWSEPVVVSTSETPPAWVGCHSSEPVGYWLVEADGTAYPFGDADDRGSAPAAGGPLAIDIEATPTGCGYWILHDDGRIFERGDAAAMPAFDLTALADGEKLTSFAPTPDGSGLWGFTDRGRVLTVGNAVKRFAGTMGDLTSITLSGPIVDAIPTPSGLGYYMLGNDGGIFAFGDAVFVNSIPGLGIAELDQPAVGLVPDPDGFGYWIVAADGGVFSFDAPFRGSFPGLRLGTLNQPVIGMTPYGNGYIQVASDGGVFNFSNKPFSGSLGANPPDTPIRALTPVW